MTVMTGNGMHCPALAVGGKKRGKIANGKSQMANRRGETTHRSDTTRNRPEAGPTNASLVIAGLECLPAGKAAREEALAGLVPTDDPNDCAHGVHILGELRPAREVPPAQKKRRLYWPCHIVVRRLPGGGVARVAIDSAFDAIAALAADLEAQGVALGWGATAAAVKDARMERLGSKARDTTTRRVRQKVPADQARAEREADRILAEAGCGKWGEEKTAHGTRQAASGKPE